MQVESSLSSREHITSFELTVHDSYLMNRLELGTVRRKYGSTTTHATFFDESDEILSVRFELVYTVGMQNDVHFGVAKA